MNTGAEPLSNRVRQVRHERGLSQLALAEAAGITRQSMSAIEAGRVTPGVDTAIRIAIALGSSAEELFGSSEQEACLNVEMNGRSNSGRLSVAYVQSRWVAHHLDAAWGSADAVVGAADGLSVELMRSQDELRDNMLIMGCASALGVLADRLNSQHGPGRFRWLSGSSTGALQALAKSTIHLAGVHLTDPTTGKANVSDVRRVVTNKKVTLITLAHWEVGLLTARNNPKKIRSVHDLTKPRIRLAGREHGSGVRRLFERQLRAEKLPLETAKSPTLLASGHLQVAQAIALGAVDAGIATRDAALAYDLDFVPWAEERYDLALASDDLGDRRVIRLLDELTSLGLRRELSCLGYDTALCGTQVEVTHVV